MMAVNTSTSTSQPNNHHNKKPNQQAQAQAVAGDAPIFLRKTFHMVETCDPELACWSKDGLTFIVKDPEQFATQIIPKFFKHSNFSSFGKLVELWWGFYSFYFNI